MENGKEGEKSIWGLRFFEGLFVLVSIGLYVWGVGWLPDFEPWLMLAVLIMALLGTFMIVESLLGKRPAHTASEIRELVEGEDWKDWKVEYKKEWEELQTRRSYQITAVAVTVIVVALALYVGNHLVGTIGGTGEDGIHWETHKDRLSVYTVQAGDMLASVAVSRGVSLEELVEANPDVQLEFNNVVTSTLDPQVKLEASVFQTPTVELEKVVQHYAISRSEVGRGFSGVTLVKDQDLRIPKPPGSDYRQWIDWLLWALIGVAAYLLIEDARHYREIPKGKADFLGETLWYWAQFITGPLIAFIVLLVLIRVDLKLFGDENGAAIAVDMSQFALDLLFVPAFLLGFYSRVGRHMLDGIMKTIFRSAWLAAHGEFEIIIEGREPEENLVKPDQSVIFKTQPATDVKWFASAGTITGATGAYTAPKADKAQDVVITAVASRGTVTSSKIIRVIPTFEGKVSVDGAELGEGKPVDPGKQVTFEISHSLSSTEEKEIQWSWSSKPKGANFEWMEVKPDESPAGKKAKGKVPANAEAGAEIIVKAKYRGLEHKLDFKVAPPPQTKLDKIETTVDDKPVEIGGTVAPDKQVAFKVSHNLSSAEAEKIQWKWSSKPDGANFEWVGDAKGAKVNGKVPAGAKADAEIEVTAEYTGSEPVAFKFKIG